MDILQITIGQIPEAIYFALFMIYAKNLNNKKIIFIGSTILQYIVLSNIFYNNIYFPISITISLYITLKLLYQEKVQITDVFLFIFCILTTIIINLIFLFVNIAINDIHICTILSKFVLFILLFIFKNKLNISYRKFYSKWNKSKNKKGKITSLTLRNISLILFNIVFIFMLLLLNLFNSGFFMNGGA